MLYIDNNIWTFRASAESVDSPSTPSALVLPLLVLKTGLGGPGVRFTQEAFFLATIPSTAWLNIPTDHQDKALKEIRPFPSFIAVSTSVGTMHSRAV